MLKVAPDCQQITLNLEGGKIIANMCTYIDLQIIIIWIITVTVFILIQGPKMGQKHVDQESRHTRTETDMQIDKLTAIQPGRQREMETVLDVYKACNPRRVCELITAEISDADSILRY